MPINYVDPKSPEDERIFKFYAGEFLLYAMGGGLGYQVNSRS